MPTRRNPPRSYSDHFSLRRPNAGRAHRPYERCRRAPSSLLVIGISVLHGAAEHKRPLGPRTSVGPQERLWRCPPYSSGHGDLAGDPFIVGQVTRISQFAAVVTSAVLRRPHRWCPSRIRSPLWITNDSKDSKCFRTDTYRRIRLQSRSSL